MALITRDPFGANGQLLNSVRSEVSNIFDPQGNTHLWGEIHCPFKYTGTSDVLGGFLNFSYAFAMGLDNDAVNLSVFWEFPNGTRVTVGNWKDGAQNITNPQAKTGALSSSVWIPLVPEPENYTLIFRFDHYLSPILGVHQSRIWVDNVRFYIEYQAREFDTNERISLNYPVNFNRSVLDDGNFSCQARFMPLPTHLEGENVTVVIQIGNYQREIGTLLQLCTGEWANYTIGVPQAYIPSQTFTVGVQFIFENNRSFLNGSEFWFAELDNVHLSFNSRLDTRTFNISVNCATVTGADPGTFTTTIIAGQKGDWLFLRLTRRDDYWLAPHHVEIRVSVQDLGEETIEFAGQLTLRWIRWQDYLYNRTLVMQERILNVITTTYEQIMAAAPNWTVLYPTRKVTQALIQNDPHQAMFFASLINPRFGGLLSAYFEYTTSGLGGSREVYATILNDALQNGTMMTMGDKISNQLTRQQEQTRQEILANTERWWEDWINTTTETPPQNLNLSRIQAYSQRILALVTEPSNNNLPSLLRLPTLRGTTGYVFSSLAVVLPMLKESAFDPRTELAVPWVDFSEIWNRETKVHAGAPVSLFEGSGAPYTLKTAGIKWDTLYTIELLHTVFVLNRNLRNWARFWGAWCSEMTSEPLNSQANSIFNATQLQPAHG